MLKCNNEIHIISTSAAFHFFKGGLSVTTEQMKYFITVATCLNYTEAANQLFISQPALSRQIISLERELNLQLFIRDTHSMRLTPAGEAFLTDIKSLYSQYLSAIEKAQQLQRGMSGSLTIGILDGHRLSETFPDLVGTLQKNYPNLSVNLFRGSFRALTDALYDGRADFIVTLNFSVEGNQQFQTIPLSHTKDYFATLCSNPLSSYEEVTISDLADQTLIAISPEDSPAAYEGMKNLHRISGSKQPLKIAPNLETLMLWVQAGLGTSILNDFNALSQDADLIFIPWRPEEHDPVCSTDLVLVWKKGSCNPASPIFLSLIPHL